MNETAYVYVSYRGEYMELPLIQGTPWRPEKVLYNGKEEWVEEVNLSTGNPICYNCANSYQEQGCYSDDCYLCATAEYRI